MNKKLKSLSLVMATAILLGGCTSDSNTSGTAEVFSTASSKLTRDLNPSVSESTQKSLAENNNAFAFNLFSKLQEEENGNIFISPYSISQALVMTYAGAAGTTKTQMSQTLHFNQDDDTLHSTFNALDLHLNYADNNYTFAIANSLWAQKDYKFSDSYLDLIKVNYGADVNLLNFAKSEKSRNIINTWVENKTQQKIKDLIPAGVLSADTRLVLTNAIYFKGDWVNEFEKDNTQDGNFTLLDGTQKEVSFMNQAADFAYASSDDYQAIELPYKGDLTSMMIVLPKYGKYQRVLADIKNVYQKVLSDKTQTNINLKLPKFDFTTDVYRLKKHLQKLGMKEPFTDAADFSGMTSEDNLKIKEILHKAFINVNELGTEAAAATAVVMGRITTILPEYETDMFINRAFIFFIKDNKSDQVLFMGLVKKP